MVNQQSYPHGLLYSVSPKDYLALRHEEKDDFDWDAYEAQFKGASLLRMVFDLLKAYAIRMGLITPSMY